MDDGCERLQLQDRCPDGRLVVTLARADECVGRAAEAKGRHVGDWEHLTIRFDATGTPSSLFVSAHGNEESDGVMTPAEIQREPNSNGTFHPKLYVAKGSHGLRVAAGATVYKTLKTGDRLTDHTGAGPRWNTWNDMVYVTGEESWSSNVFAGRWGNAHMGDSACDVADLQTICTVLALSPLLGLTCAIAVASDRPAVCRAASIPLDEYELNDGPGGSGSDWIGTTSFFLLGRGFSTTHRARTSATRRATRPSPVISMETVGRTTHGLVARLLTCSWVPATASSRARSNPIRRVWTSGRAGNPSPGTSIETA